jgi:hypothetical protein
MSTLGGRRGQRSWILKIPKRALSVAASWLGRRRAHTSGEYGGGKTRKQDMEQECHTYCCHAKHGLDGVHNTQNDNFIIAVCKQQSISIANDETIFQQDLDAFTL